jgi:[ribosomal protein S5]-alanine N-acetyltransferase
VLPLPQTLNTTRLRLRGPVASDANAIFQSYTQDPEVCRFMIWRPHASESVTEEFIASCAEEWKTGSRLPYVITELHANVAIGMLEARMQGTTVDIGYVLARSHWGKGYMPEAIQALTGVALQSASVFRVQATCDTETTPSQRALEKSGFSREGRLERHTAHPNISPEPRACFMYAKCRQGENAL